MKPDAGRDPTVPPLLYCARCVAQRQWVQREGQFFCASCDTQNGMTPVADDKRRAKLKEGP